MSFEERWNDWALFVPHLVAMVFAFAFGACAGSFINVVAWRLPQGMSIVSPPSRCPTCGYRLRWIDNLPVLGYLRLRGRCAACKVHIPIHYLLVELTLGALFVLVYAVLFLPKYGTFWYSAGQGWWAAQGIGRALPALIVVLFAIGSLAAMTLSDARTFHIPLAIPVIATLVAFCGWLVQGFTAAHMNYLWPIDVPPDRFVLAGLFGTIGVIASWMLLRVGALKPSFADYEQYVKPGETFADYPHSRREMAKELAFLLPPAIGVALGYLLAGQLQFSTPYWLQGIAACACGFVVGGAVVWLLRIAVTFAFNVEALGLGDVHLMACVGAAFGWRGVLIGFIAAPFIALAWWVANLVRHAPMRVPFGPSLAVGGVAAFLLYPVCLAIYSAVRSWMALLADWARANTGLVLVVAGLLAVGAVFAAFKTGTVRRRAGVWAAVSIMLCVGGVMAWIFGSTGGLLPALGIGLVLALASAASVRLARADSEEEPGPRTALTRIMLLMVAIVVLLGVFLAFVTAMKPPPEMHEIVMPEG